MWPIPHGPGDERPYHRAWRQGDDEAITERPSVFICYSTADREIAQQVYDALIQAGVEVFEFERTARPGEGAWSQVNDAIKQADWFVALLSNEATRSSAVRGEIEYATWCRRNYDEPIIVPAPLEEIDAMPSLIEHLTTLEFSDPSRAIGRLVGLVTSDGDRRDPQVPSSVGRGAARAREPRNRDVFASVSDRLSGGDQVALVLSGSGARGAFQAGALASVLPTLEEAGIRPSIVLGSGTGAFNAALYGSMAHLRGEQWSAELEEIWRRLSVAEFIRPILTASSRTSVQMVSGAILGIGGGVTSLLDIEPFSRTVDELLDFGRLGNNVWRDRPAVIGLTATRIPPRADVIVGTSAARSVLFLHEHHRGDYEGDPEGSLDVVRTPIAAEHVLASAAIPVVFPPVHVAHTFGAEGWYVDGTVRLSSPLGPAIGLGADTIIVISSSSTEAYMPFPPDIESSSPDVAQTGAQLLHAAYRDHLVADLGSLRRTNRWVDGRGDEVGHRDDRAGYRRIRYMTISPPSGELGRLAARIYDEKATGISPITGTDRFLLGRALRGVGAGAGVNEFLSYFLFDEDYFAASLELGRDTAVRALAAGWQT